VSIKTLKSGLTFGYCKKSLITNVIPAENWVHENNLFSTGITFVIRDFLQYPNVSPLFKVLIDTITYFMKLLRYNISPYSVNIVGIPTVYAAN